MAFSHPIDTQSDYFDVAIQFSHNSPGIGDDTADFFVNGQLVGDDVTRTSVIQAGGHRFVDWGAISSAGVADVHFERVALVPLPAAAWMGLVMLGGMAGVGAVRRKFRRE